MKKPFFILLIIVSLSGCAKSSVDRNFHIYIAFGQSNMQGPGGIEAQDKEGISDRFLVLNVIPGVYNGEEREAGKWYKAAPPLLIPDRNLINWKGLPTGLSPADYFGRTLAENTPDKIKIGVVAVASGDLALAAFDKTRALDYYNGIGTVSGRPSNTEKQGMERYDRNIYGAIIETARLAQNTGVIKGIIVHQGESGVGFEGISWTSLLKTIYDDILSDLGLKPNSVPILLGQTFNGGTGLTDGALNADNRIRETIPAARVISSEGCAGRLEPDGISIDNIHFGSEGLRELGRRYGQAMLQINYSP